MNVVDLHNNKLKDVLDPVTTLGMPSAKLPASVSVSAATITMPTATAHNGWKNSKIDTPG
jgi:hypothetical protein